MSAKDVIKELKKYANKQKAVFVAGYFKTGKGQYGEGDVFWGISVPDQRAVAKTFQDLPLEEVETLLTSDVHEHRLTGLEILCFQFKKANEAYKKKLADFYLAHTKWVNNWDLVDSSASYILGMYLLDKKRDILYTLVRSKNLWERRIAVIATHAFIKNDQFEDTLRIAELLLGDTHDLIHKAVGWMLREVGKRDKRVLTDFLDTYAKIMPRTMLRYAIEKFDENLRKFYLIK